MLIVGLAAGLHAENLAFIDHELPVIADVHFETVERARGRTFEVESGFIEATAVARALELVLRREPSRRAAEMRAFGEDRVDALLLAHDPDALVLLELL